MGRDCGQLHSDELLNEELLSDELLNEELLSDELLNSTTAMTNAIPPSNYPNCSQNQFTDSNCSVSHAPELRKARPLAAVNKRGGKC